MRLFSSERTEDYIKEIRSKIEREIEELSEEKITTDSIDDWVDYFVSKYQIDPILVYEDKAELNMEEVKIKKYNIFYEQDSSFEPEFFQIDGYKIIFKIPFYGKSDLFNLQPSTYIISNRFEVDKIINPQNDKLGYLYYSFERNKDEFIGKKDSEIRIYVDNEFKREFRSYLNMIEYLNKDINVFNESIEKLIRNELELRKDKANNFENIKRALKIQKVSKEDVSNIKIIPLKKKKKMDKPNVKNIYVEPEPCISDFDYNNILDIIHNACSVMESTPQTFNKYSEEELRDSIISTLGTHYVNDVTGETFRGLGKTDIHIMFENKSAFIGECKIWNGIKKFEDAIKQILGYLTWKDTKISLIVFNKKNKDFQSILNSIDSWIKKNTKQSKKENSNTWKCLMYREDTNSDIQIAIQVYDISI